MPIDIASGTVSLAFEDFFIPGKVPLTWDRTYSSALSRSAAARLGVGWTNRYFMRLTRREGGFDFVTPNGAVERFTDPDGLVDRGGVVLNPGAFLDLSAGSERYEIRSWNPDTGHLWRYGFGLTASDGTFVLTRIEHIAGYGLDLTYDDQERLTRIQQSVEQRALTLGYDAAGRISAVDAVAPDGSSYPLCRYEYAPQGGIAAALDAYGYADRFEYDGEGRLIRHILKDGAVFAYRYDAQNRCVWYSGLDHYDEKRLRFFDAARTTNVTDSYGATSTYQWIPTGQIVAEADPLGAVTRTEYDDQLRIVAKIGPTGGVTRYAYDTRGNRAETVTPTGDTFRFTFNDDHQPTSLEEPDGGRWSWTYDNRGRLVLTVNPLGGEWQQSYDDDANLVRLSNPNGDTCRFVYRAGMRVAQTDWVGNETALEYDALGRLLARTDATGGAYRYTMDLGGNVVRVTPPDGGELQYEYDVNGNLIRFVDAAGRVLTRRFGPCSRLLEDIDPNGNRLGYVWGTEPGRLEQIINERGERHTFTYDATGQCIGETRFDDSVVEYAYDAAGYCVRTVNGAGEAVRFIRDPAGRIAGWVLPDGASARFAYDGLGNIVEAVNDDCAVKLERDVMGRLVRQVQRTSDGEHWVASVLDGMGETTFQETDLGLRVDFGLDANGWLAAVKVGDHETRFERDPRGLEVARALGAGHRFEQRRDAIGRVMEQQLIGARAASASGASRRGAPAALVLRTYTRDRSGLVTSVADSLSGTTRYAYDAGERLLTARRDREQLSESFEYDVTGNLTRVRQFTATERTDDSLRYGKGNRLLQKGTTTYEYDGHGRLTRKAEHSDTESPAVWTYAWDALDQLRSLTRPDGSTWTYAYDAFGRRIRKSSSDRHVQYVYNGRTPVHELAGPRAKDRTTWVFRPGEFIPLLKLSGRSTYAVITDQLGTPHEMIGTRGELAWVHRSAAYGVPELQTRENAQSCPFRFQGQYDDAESGLRYNMFRYYDPECGRFISPDPLGVKPGMNLYLYAPNPVAWVDPWGLCRRGNAATQKHMDDVRDQFLKENPGFVLVAGGRDPVTGLQLPEAYLRPLTPGTGTKGCSFVDMTFHNPTTGDVVHVQTVDPQKSGPAGMTQREFDNAQRISNQAPGTSVVTVNKGSTPAPGSLDASGFTSGPGNVNYK